jgi:hypothetical protein
MNQLNKGKHLNQNIKKKRKAFYERKKQSHI